MTLLPLPQWCPVWRLRDIWRGRKKRYPLRYPQDLSKQKP
jgi:hypothetical protein